ncbi:MAG: YeeE/YedE thiosulfate transporter family protein [Vicingaceae bacterium]
MWNWIFETWPWYVSGAAIALVMFLLLMMGKKFGMSSNLRTLCSICGAGKRTSFFDYDWKAQKWNLVVVAGVIIGGFIATNYLTTDAAVKIDSEVVNELKGMGFETAGEAYLPKEIYGPEDLGWKSILILIAGGLLVGFGTRYAGGCTSGHAISGLSSLQWPSLIAVIGFFAGGLFMVHLLFPIIFK